MLDSTLLLDSGVEVTEAEYHDTQLHQQRSLNAWLKNGTVWTVQSFARLAWQGSRLRAILQFTEPLAHCIVIANKVAMPWIDEVMSC